MSMVTSVTNLKEEFMYKLCGGTLLVLLVHSGNKGTTEPSLLSDTLKVFKSDLFIDKCTLKEQTKKFKLCKEHSSLATPFEDSSLQKQLTDDIKNNYVELLKRTSELIDHYIDTDSQTKKGELLVKALLEVIEKDNSIPDQQKFHILPNGKAVKKDKLLSMKKFYLPSFLLGIFFYVIINIKNNKEGAETYDTWCPKPQYETKRKYTANIGENSSRHILLLKSPEEYSYHELLELSDEAVTCYIKKIPNKTDYDIATSPIIVSNNIDISDADAYHDLLLNSYDYKKLISFIHDFNQLIMFINLFQKNKDPEKINIIGNSKKKFFQNWIVSSRYFKFDNSSLKKWFEYVLDSIKNSKIIDIYNVTIVEKPLVIVPNINLSTLLDYPKQKIHNLYTNKDDKDDNLHK